MTKKFTYRFHNRELYEQALTHRSVGRHNNERLEFLGDALVNLMVAEMIFEAFPKADEGELTRLRARLVNGAALAEIARELELGDALNLGTGELKSGGFRRESILADAFEALIAAVYLDGGWEICRQQVRLIFADRLAPAALDEDKDPKTLLQELLQAQRFSLPVYDLLAATGAEHAKVFDVSCVVNDAGIHTTGRGTSRRAAEQNAAAAALTYLQSMLKHAKQS